MKAVDRFLKSYLDSWWLPFTVSLCNLAVFMVLFFPLIGTSYRLSIFFVVVLILLLLGLVVSVLCLAISVARSLIRQRWIKFFSDILMLCLFLGACYFSMALLFAAAMDVGEENFSYGNSAQIIGLMSRLLLR